VPGQLSPAELSRLVDVTISSGAWLEPPSENGRASQLREVDLEESIDSAAASMVAQARRKKQTFRSTVAGNGVMALGDPERLTHSLASLLLLVTTAAPASSRINVEAEALEDEWVVRVAASTRPRTAGRVEQALRILRQNTPALRSVAEAMKAQRGMLWVELQSSGLPAFALTLPTATRSTRQAG
jgi:hypothetical protein